MERKGGIKFSSIGSNLKKNSIKTIKILWRNGAKGWHKIFLSTRRRVEHLALLIYHWVSQTSRCHHYRIKLVLYNNELNGRFVYLTTQRDISEFHSVVIGWLTLCGCLSEG